MKKSAALAGAIFLVIFISFAYVDAAVLYEDNFEDGSINNSLWIYGGQKLGNEGVGGDWNWMHEEIMAPDGYLKARVWGPYTGLTYTGAAWVRTTKNFKDGESHIINFVWEPNYSDTHANEYFIQITDGHVGDSIWWQNEGNAGTTDFLWREDGNSWTRGLIFDGGEPPGKLSWSLEILPSGMARLYDAPNRDGVLIDQESLNPNRDWYFRIMVLDGTSDGFSSGEAWFNLYDFSVDAVVDKNSQRISVLESNVSVLFSWKKTIDSWKTAMDSWKTALTSTLSNITTAINGLTTKTNTQETRIKALENKTCLCNQTAAAQNYLKYLSSSDRKKMVCGYAEEKHMNNLVDLGWNCTVTYRQTSRGERATCRCEEIK